MAAVTSVAVVLALAAAALTLVAVEVATVAAATDTDNNHKPGRQEPRAASLGSTFPRRWAVRA